MLQVRRSLGDNALKDAGSTTEPAYQRLKITKEDACLVLGSDGVWDVLGMDELAAICKEHLGSAMNAAQAITLRARELWQPKAEDTGTRDDISACVIYLPFRSAVEVKNPVGFTGKRRQTVMQEVPVDNFDDSDESSDSA